MLVSGQLSRLSGITEYPCGSNFNRRISESICLQLVLWQTLLGTQRPNILFSREIEYLQRVRYASLKPDGERRLNRRASYYLSSCLRPYSSPQRAEEAIWTLIHIFHTASNGALDIATGNF